MHHTGLAAVYTDLHKSKIAIPVRVCTNLQGNQPIGDCVIAHGVKSSNGSRVNTDISAAIAGTENK